MTRLVRWILAKARLLARALARFGAGMDVGHGGDCACLACERERQYRRTW